MSSSKHCIQGGYIETLFAKHPGAIGPHSRKCGSFADQLHTYQTELSPFAIEILITAATGLPAYHPAGSYTIYTFRCPNYAAIIVIVVNRVPLFATPHTQYFSVARLAVCRELPGGHSTVHYTSSRSFGSSLHPIPAMTTTSYHPSAAQQQLVHKL